MFGVEFADNFVILACLLNQNETYITNTYRVPPKKFLIELPAPSFAPRNSKGTFRDTL